MAGGPRGPLKKTDQNRVPTTLNLWRITVEHLDDLSQVLGTTREQIVESLVDDRWASRHKELSEPCPWEITGAAIQDVQDELARLKRPNDRDAALEVITAAAIDAVTADRERRRAPIQQDNGALRYRGPKPMRLSLFVRDGAIVQVTAFDRGRR